MRVVSLNSIASRLSIICRTLFSLGNNEVHLQYLKRTGIVSIGVHTYGKPRVYAWDNKTKLIIGKYCSISENVTFLLGGNHRMDWISTFPFSEFQDTWPTAKGLVGHPATRGDVNVGNDVWIGHGAVILSGIRIGDGAVIGAGSVISRDVAPYSIVAGNPAIEIRLRFSAEEIEKLLKIKWWDWPDDLVRVKVVSLCSGIKDGLSNLENNV
jgi:chloramphenicol O-acetyltransferase type B